MGFWREDFGRGDDVCLDDRTLFKALFNEGFESEVRLPGRARLLCLGRSHGPRRGGRSTSRGQRRARRGALDERAGPDRTSQQPLRRRSCGRKRAKAPGESAAVSLEPQGSGPSARHARGASRQRRRDQDPLLRPVGPRFRRLRRPRRRARGTSHGSGRHDRHEDPHRHSDAAALLGNRKLTISIPESGGVPRWPCQRLRASIGVVTRNDNLTSYSTTKNTSVVHVGRSRPLTSIHNQLLRASSIRGTHQIGAHSLDTLRTPRHFHPRA